MQMNAGSKADFIDPDITGKGSSFFEKQAYIKPASLDYAPSQLELHAYTSQEEDFFLKRKGDADLPLFLVTMYKGIGDAVLVGLSFVDHIIKEDPHAFGKIDILCNSVQAVIFEHD